MFLLKGAAIVMAVLGVLALADGVLTLVWQEPISGILAHFQQARLADNLKRLEAARATPADERALAGLASDNQRMAFFAAKLQRTARAGQAVGRIRIPRIGANFVVVAGTDESSLQKGPGVYAGTAVPGLRGTVGIAGHRTTYLAPFRRINELAPGDRITLEMPYGLFSYTVLRQQIVSPTDVSVLRRESYDQIVLTACNPLYSAAQRIVVFARLSAAAPGGPALTTLAAGAAAAPPEPIPAAQAAQTVFGDTPPDALAPVGGALPSIATGSVLLGDAPAGAAHPSARARRAPAAATSSAAPSRAPAAVPVAPRPVIVPTPVRRAPVASAPLAPRVPERPAPVVPRPTVKVPSSAPAPKSSAPPATPPQTRVQGRPGGPQPIINVTSG